MKSTKTILSEFELQNKLIYRVNSVLVILFGLLFFTGTILHFYNIPTATFLSEGNILTLFLLLFVFGIFMSYYSEKLAGILLVIIGIASFVFSLYHLENWIVHSIAFFSITGSGLFFLTDYLREKKEKVI